MKFNEITIRILVRKNYAECFDFYTKQLGLVAVWGDRNGPYTSFSTKEGESPCFAIFSGENMIMYKGYEQPETEGQYDTIVAVIPSEDIKKDYQRLKELGVCFLGEPQYIEDWGMECLYFRDPEGNLFEINNATSL